MVNIDTLSDFIEIYEENNDEEKNVRNHFSQTISKYFKFLANNENDKNNEKMKKISESLILKFAENKSLQKLRSAKLLLKFYKNNEKERKKDVFSSMKKKLLLINNSNYGKVIHSYNNTNNMNSINSINNTSNNKYINNYNNNNKYNNNSSLYSGNSQTLNRSFSSSKLCSNHKHYSETTIQKIEAQNLKQCTFKPQVNKNYEFNLNSRDNDTFNRLYTENERLNKRKIMRQLARDNYEAKQLRDVPNLSLTTQNYINVTSPSFNQRLADVYLFKLICSGY